MKGADSLAQIVRVNGSQVLTTVAGGGKALSFKGSLSVKYYYQREPSDYWESHLVLTGAMVEIEENGSYFPPEDMVADGYWAQSEKICNMLPLDYPMPMP